MFVQIVAEEGGLVEADPGLRELHLDVAFDTDVSKELIDFLEELVGCLGAHENVVEHEDATFAERIENLRDDDAERLTPSIMNLGLSGPSTVMRVMSLLVRSASGI